MTWGRPRSCAWEGEIALEILAHLDILTRSNRVLRRIARLI